MADLSVSIMKWIQRGEMQCLKLKDLAHAFMKQNIEMSDGLKTAQQAEKAAVKERAVLQSVVEDYKERTGGGAEAGEQRERALMLELVAERQRSAQLMEELAKAQAETKRLRNQSAKRQPHSVHLTPLSDHEKVEVVAPLPRASLCVSRNQPYP